MKKIHIIGLIVIALSMGLLAVLVMNFGQHATFSEMRDDPGKTFKFTGELVVADDMPVDFDPRNPGQFAFYAKDPNGTIERILCYDKMPFDFERVDEVIMKVKHENGMFVGRDLLTKCPSKYDNGAIDAKAQAE